MKKLQIFLTSLFIVLLVGCQQNSSPNQNPKISEAVDKVKLQLEQAINHEQKINEQAKQEKAKSEDDKQKSQPALDPSSAD